MSQRFEYEFEEAQANCINFEYSPDEDEVFQVSHENGSMVVCLNRSALLTLAKLLIKMSLGPYTNGFHVHLNTDFDADQPECLTVMLSDQQTDASRNGRSRVESSSTILG